MASVMDVQATRMAERLRLYRSCVARVARGELVPREDVEDLKRAMRSLMLPSFAFRRDVAAVKAFGRACSHRRRELALNHPQLFVEVEEWVRERVRAAARRGVRPCHR